MLNSVSRMLNVYSIPPPPRRLAEKRRFVTFSQNFFHFFIFPFRCTDFAKFVKNRLLMIVKFLDIYHKNV